MSDLNFIFIDTLAHSLTSIIVGMEAAKKLLDKNLDRARLELEKSREQARRDFDDVRRSVKAEPLPDGNIGLALDIMAAWLEDLGS